MHALVHCVTVCTSVDLHTHVLAANQVCMQRSVAVSRSNLTALRLLRSSFCRAGAFEFQVETFTLLSLLVTVLPLLPCFRLSLLCLLPKLSHVKLCVETFLEGK